MSEYTITKHIEIPVTVVAEYTPAEAPDYSETSPCPGSPEEVDFIRIDAPGIPLLEKFIDNHDPDFWESAREDIIELAKKDDQAEAEATAAAKEDARKEG